MFVLYMLLFARLVEAPNGVGRGLLRQQESCQTASAGLSLSDGTCVIQRMQMPECVCNRSKVRHSSPLAPVAANNYTHQLRVDPTLRLSQQSKLCGFCMQVVLEMVELRELETARAMLRQTQVRSSSTGGATAQLQQQYQQQERQQQRQWSKQGQQR